VALQGSTAVVGASDRNIGGVQQGAVYVYEHDGTAWNLMAELVDSNGQAGDEFGNAVALSNDWLLVGARGDDDYGNDSGSVYFFQRNSGSWNEIQQVIVANASAQAYFGTSMTVSGMNLIAGAPGNGTSINGRVYGFYFDGGYWIEDWYLEHMETFGSSIGFEAPYLFVGVPEYRIYPRESAGAALLYRWDSDWSLDYRIQEFLPPTSDHFGQSVDLDAGCFVVGYPENSDNAPLSGAVMVYQEIY